jgi:hypothetical protein
VNLAVTVLAAGFQQSNAAQNRQTDPSAAAANGSNGIPQVPAIALRQRFDLLE